MKKKTIAIAGIGGLIGGTAAEYFKDHQILGIRRKDFELEDSQFVKKYERADIIMNFAGTPVIKRWTKKNKEEILSSRIMTTRKLWLIAKQGEKKQRLYISASGIGLYSDTGRHTEQSVEFGSGFMKQVVEAWEKEAMKLKGDNCKVAILRTGVVLTRQGGMLGRILPLFRAGIGGRIGNGRQSFSWIHGKDMMRAIEHIIQNNKDGIYNIVSPGSCTNAHFTKTLGNLLKKPTIIAVPKFALRIVFGQGAEVVSGGQNVIPGRLIKEKFKFDFETLHTALGDIVN